MFRDWSIFSVSPEKMFKIVADVEKYREFVPYCKGSKIISSNGNSMKAELTVGFHSFEEKYVSNVDLDHPNKVKVCQLKFVT
jgi:coenzyme Q-binding protein COQ10